MQSFHMDSFEGLDGLVRRESPTPEPSAGQVLIRVRARSLNFRDLLILEKRYPIPARAGTVALSDGAGEVVAVGPGVQRVAVGDKVSCAYFPRWLDGRLSMELALEQFGCTRDGMLSDHVLAPEQAVVKIAPLLSFEEASTLPCAGVTAWSALTGPRPVLPGDTVLTIGTGGVALFALQFARLMGARVISLTSTDEKEQRLRALGAHEVLNYRKTPEWGMAVRELTAGRGADHVVETGGADTLRQSISCTAVDGQVASIAALGNADGSPSLIDARVLGSPVTMRRVFVGSRAAFEAMNRAIALHALRPVVDKVFAFDDARSAYQHFASRKHIGKVVIAGG